MSKKLYVVFVLLFFNTGCEKEIEVKRVSGVKCEDCSTVLSAETVTVVMHKKEIKDKLQSIDNEYYLLYYSDSLCAQCVAKREQRAKQLYSEGMTAYRQKNYQMAKDKFMKSFHLGYEKAQTWISKAHTKVQEAERVAKEQAAIATRKAYAQLAREHFLDNGMNIKVRVHGPKYKYITLTYSLIGDVFVHNFRKSDMCREMRELGFQRIYFKDGYDYSMYAYWED